MTGPSVGMQRGRLGHGHVAERVLFSPCPGPAVRTDRLRGRSEDMRLSVHRGKNSLGTFYSERAEGPGGATVFIPLPGEHPRCSWCVG